MTIKQLDPWLSAYVRLAQLHKTLFLDLVFDGTYRGTILQVDSLQNVASVNWTAASVDRGTLTIHGLIYAVQGVALVRYHVASDEYRPRTLHAVDGVPWEIHKIEDPVARAAARGAYIRESYR